MHRARHYNEGSGNGSEIVGTNLALTLRLDSNTFLLEAENRFPLSPDLPVRCSWSRWGGLFGSLEIPSPAVYDCIRTKQGY